MTRYRACLLCGAETGQAIELRMVRWREPMEGHEYDALPRCVAVEACRQRIWAAGGQWEVADGFPPRREPVAEPVAAVEGTPAGGLSEVFA